MVKVLNKVRSADERLAVSVGKIHKPLLDKLMRTMSFLGSGGKIWFIFTAGVYAKIRSAGVFFAMLISLALSWLVTEVIIKHIVRRDRPFHKLDIEELAVKKKPSFYSFPSSHSATSFAVFTVILLLCSHWLALAAFAFAAGVSFSRFYLQVHYLTDVLCGIVFGIVCALLVVKVIFILVPSLNLP